MKTNVSSILVLPDDPCLTQPVVVAIRTSDGKLMRHRLRKLLKEDKVVFVDTRLICELIDELDAEISNTESWMAELMALKCPKDVAMLQELRLSLKDDEGVYRHNSADYAKLCFACRELWVKVRENVGQLQVVKEYSRIKERMAKDY